MASWLLTALASIFVFGLVIFVHELGHFVMAKLMGVKVNEFAMGMGPKLLQFGKKETKYTLRLLPIGGFCSMEGEDEAGAGSVALPSREDEATTRRLYHALDAVGVRLADHVIVADNDYVSMADSGFFDRLQSGGY